MKTRAITVKQGFAVMIAFVAVQLCLFRNPVITILKVVGFENCMRENELPLLAGGQPEIFKGGVRFLNFLHM